MATNATIALNIGNDATRAILDLLAIRGEIVLHIPDKTRLPDGRGQGTGALPEIAERGGQGIFCALRRRNRTRRATWREEIEQVMEHLRDLLRLVAKRAFVKLIIELEEPD